MEYLFSTVQNKATKQYDLVEHRFPIYYEEIDADEMLRYVDSINNDYGIGLKPESCWVTVGSKLHKKLKKRAIPYWEHCID